MQSAAPTVAAYLAELPQDRRAAVAKIRAMMRKNLPKGFAEVMNYGMIGYVAPHKHYPPGYHCDPKSPLPFAGLASQKNHLAIDVMTVYQSPEMEKWLREAFAKAGKKLDMGKSCIRFKKLEDVPLDVIGEAVARVPMADYIMQYEDGLKRQRAGRVFCPRNSASTGRPESGIPTGGT
ncbi:MAG: DUF1801 domain-containing protein, partial [Acidobacteria bacterium]|nr:DUF1801 domain-containing protein [Acidobacteriota bacterium]